MSQQADGWREPEGSTYPVEFDEWAGPNSGLRWRDGTETRPRSGHVSWIETVGAKALTAEAKARAAEAKASTAEAKASTAEAKALTAEAKASTAGAEALTAGAEALTAEAETLTAGAKSSTVEAKALTVGASPSTAGAHSRRDPASSYGPYQSDMGTNSRAWSALEAMPGRRDNAQKEKAAADSISGLIHDTRNMIMSIYLYCDLLDVPGVLASPFRHYADELRMVAARSHGLLEKMSAASRVEAKPESGSIARLSNIQSPFDFGGVDVDLDADLDADLDDDADLAVALDLNFDLNVDGRGRHAVQLDQVSRNLHVVSDNTLKAAPEAALVASPDISVDHSFENKDGVREGIHDFSVTTRADNFEAHVEDGIWDDSSDLSGSADRPEVACGPFNRAPSHSSRADGTRHPGIIQRGARAKAFELNHAVRSFADELLANHRLLSALAGSAITIGLSIEGGNRPVAIASDDLTRVLVNLVRNAADAMPNGGHIQIALEESFGSLCLSIADTGTGIAEESLETIFSLGYSTHIDVEDGFDQHNGQDKTGWPTQHRGLGLAIVRSIVTAAGGAIWATNRKRSASRVEPAQHDLEAASTGEEGARPGDTTQRAAGVNSANHRVAGVSSEDREIADFAAPFGTETGAVILLDFPIDCDVERGGIDL